MKAMLVAAAVLLAAAVNPHAQTSAPKLPLHLTAGLISAGAPGNPAGVGRIEIRVARWSTAGERSGLIEALTQHGQDALREALIDAKPVGTVRFNTELAYDLHYARALPDEEGGTRVFLATDRPMSVLEVWNQPRYSNYPFTLLELRFSRGGDISGSLVLAARVSADRDGRFITVENYATEPIALTNVKVE
jgi:hypothetical protein